MLNVINQIFLKTKLWDDSEFQKWYQSQTSHKVTTVILFTLSLLFQFLLSRMIISKMFAFKFFKAKLISIEQLNPFNVINGVYIILSCIPAIVSSVFFAYYEEDIDQLFISSLDALFCTILLILFIIWET